MSPLWTAAATTLALLAFAGNSILCRSALGQGAIEAGAFTWVRLMSGALVLGVLSGGRAGSAPVERPWRGAMALLLYAAAFSFAYVRLPAGVGALVLFGATQVTMIGVGLRKGERPSVAEWAGIAIAVLGLAVLASPGRTAPHPGALGLMALAGLGWGIYSLLGRAQASPLAANAASFARAAAAATLLLVLPHDGPRVTTVGLTLAAASGALASGLGYCLWYLALPHLTRTRAAALQLVVPVLAAAAGVAFLGETITTRLLFSGVLTLGGVGLALRGLPSGQSRARIPGPRETPRP
jgi:drug/metabolite transporter (DMT)-like permease